MMISPLRNFLASRLYTKEQDKIGNYVKTAENLKLFACYRNRDTTKKSMTLFPYMENTRDRFAADTFITSHDTV